MDKSKSKLFVGGLGQNATEHNLYGTFDKFGKIEDACIVYDKETGNSRGFGYVTFSEQPDAEAAMKALRGMMIDGKEINVEYANAKDPAKEAAKRMNRFSGGAGGGAGGGGGGGSSSGGSSRGGGSRGGGPRGRGGPFRGRGGPPGRGMGHRGRGYPDRRPPPPSRGYDGYGSYCGDQYGQGRGYERDYSRERDGYGYPPAGQREGYESYPPQRPDAGRRDGPPPQRRDGPPPPRDGGGYDRYPQAERERYPPSDRGRPGYQGGGGSGGGGGGGGGADRYQQDRTNYNSGENYSSNTPVDRYGGPPPATGQRNYGRDW